MNDTLYKNYLIETNKIECIINDQEEKYNNIKNEILSLKLRRSFLKDIKKHMEKELYIRIKIDEDEKLKFYKFKEEYELKYDEHDVVEYERKDIGYKIETLNNKLLILKELLKKMKKALKYRKITLKKIGKFYGIL